MSAADVSGGGRPAVRASGRYSPLLLLSLACVACTTSHRVQDMSDAVCGARKAGGPPFPRLQQRFPALDESTAYSVQRDCTRRLLRRGERIAGYKAGLTGSGQPARFGLSREALGVLLHAARLHPQPSGIYRVPVQDYHRPMIEMETALLLGEDLHASLPDVATLKRVVAGVAAAVELPDLGFTGGGLPTGPELVAANVSARYFILGPLHPPRYTELDALRVELRRDGRVVHRGRGTDLALPQWEMGRRLLNRLLARGYSLRQGQILLTGAMGGLHPAQAGEYEADFGALGLVRFRVPGERAETSP